MPGELPMPPAMVGKISASGPNVNASNLTKLINEEKVTVAIGIPTIWEELLLLRRR